MTPELHAQAKKIFFQAIDLPPSERLPFVRRACEKDATLQYEVETLLASHTQQTLLPARAAPLATEPESIGNHRLGKTAFALPQSDLAMPRLVLSDLWQENRSLLQRRLRVLAGVLGAIMVYTVALHVWRSRPLLGMLDRALLGVVTAVVLWMLRPSQRPTLRSLRTVELVLTLGIGLAIVAMDVREMIDLAGQGDASAIRSGMMWNHVAWSLLILIYGLFIPNTPQRAAWLLLPVSLIPFVVQWLMEWRLPSVAAAMQADTFGMPLPISVFSAGIAIMAARTIHSTRLSAFRARRLVQYELLRVIGAGGMGTVYEAHHVMLKRPCAIKIVHARLAQEAPSLDRFEKEVRATSTLTHPHTIEVFDFGESSDGRFFYVMELLPGCNLKEFVETYGPLPPARAVHLIHQIAGALQEAHGRGMFHRDVKPANIIVSERGGIHDFAKLLDFGLVRQVRETLPASYRPGKTTAGTPAYMSPEQIRDYESIDGRSDLYSLGAVLFYLLTGQPPFDSSHTLQVLLAHLDEPVPALTDFRSDISPELRAVMERCLEKAAGDRYPDAKSLRLALAACPEYGGWSSELAEDWWQAQAANP